MFTILVLAVLGAAAFGGYKLYQQYKAGKAAGAVTGSGVSAFARLAEVDGKIFALKIAAEAKKEEALAQAAVVEEIHKILG